MSAPAVLPLLVGDLGTPELLIILAVVVLLFGSSKLPELARGSGRALRIFKAETKGLIDDEDDAPTAPTTPPAASASSASSPAPDAEARRRELAVRQAELDAERKQLRGQSAG